MTEETVTVRPMTVGDLEFAQALTDGEGWGNSARDWERLHSLDVGLVAEVEGTAAGVCTANDYGELGNIGNFVVAPAQRDHGTGRALVEAALERLTECRAVRVHALMPSAGFYRALGFVAEGMSTHFRLSPEMHALAPFDAGDAGMGMARDDWEEILALDTRQFGGDRSALLGTLAAAVPEATLEILVPSPNFRVTSLLETQGWEAVDYTLAMIHGGEWSDESNICARAGGDKG